MQRDGLVGSNRFVSVMAVDCSVYGLTICLLAFIFNLIGVIVIFVVDRMRMNQVAVAM